MQRSNEQVQAHLPALPYGLGPEPEYKVPDNNIDRGLEVIRRLRSGEADWLMWITCGPYLVVLWYCGLLAKLQKWVK